MLDTYTQSTALCAGNCRHKKGGDLRVDGNCGLFFALLPRVDEGGEKIKIK